MTNPAFNDVDLTPLCFRDRPCWLARQIGQALGYGSGRVLVDQITALWRNEFVEGRDFVTLIAAELRAVKALAKAAGISMEPRTPRTLLLFEPGVQMVCLKTSKPAGIRLRRFLVDDVLPQISRTNPDALHGQLGGLIREAAADVHQRSTEEKIYFISGASGGPIKIGFSSNVDDRLASLQTSSPIKLAVLATTPGGRTQEKEMHERFDTARLEGEWFRRTPELMSLIEGLKNTVRA